MEDQDEFIIRKSDGEELDLEDDNKTALEDIEHNADLYCISPIKRSLSTQN